MGHFPAYVPAYARNARFYSQQGFGQAGTLYQLRYKAPVDRIAVLYDYFATRATHRFYGGDSNDHSVATTSFYTGDGEKTYSPFPKDYEILVL